MDSVDCTCRFISFGSTNLTCLDSVGRCSSAAASEGSMLVTGIAMQHSQVASASELTVHVAFAKEAYAASINEFKAVINDFESFIDLGVRIDFATNPRVKAKCNKAITVNAVVAAADGKQVHWLPSATATERCPRLPCRPLAFGLQVLLSTFAAIAAI